MAVTGAAIVLSTFAGPRWGLRRSFAAAVRRKSNRIGCVFMLVGPNLATSYRSRSMLSGTGLSSQPLCVRASRNSWRRLLSSMRRGALVTVSRVCIANPHRLRRYEPQRILLARFADGAVTLTSSRRGKDDLRGPRRDEVDS